MTRIDFYHYADDKLHFACRLATKAFERESKVVAYSSDPKVLSAFDRLLWTFQSVKFVPHCRAGETIAAETPVILATAGDEVPHHDVLLNLDDEWPPFFASFERLLEIVATDDEDKQKARGRYAFYKKRGYEIRVNAIEPA
ncbi:MAG: DNA polymerase III subunit chi [Betaproteobacteria bacterium]|nr:DNA polymerase III subunit chi [Betaproteobacteria bacterium]